MSKLPGYKNISTTNKRPTLHDGLFSLKAIQASHYRGIDLDRLVLYAVGELRKKQIDLSFENIVVASFKLFPEKFSLLGFPTYPDSDRVQNCLNRCTRKSKQWLGGKSRHGFFITDRSRAFIKQANELIRHTPPERPRAPSQTRRKESILSDITSTTAYQKFSGGKTEAISNAEVCFALQGTLDTPKETLRENLAVLKQYAAELGNRDVVSFAEWLSQWFESNMQSHIP